MVSTLRSFLKKRCKRPAVAAVPVEEEAATIWIQDKLHCNKEYHKRPQHVQEPLRPETTPIEQSNIRRGLVRFAEECNVAHDNTTFCKEECSLFWYNEQDYNIFRQEKAIETKRAQLLEKHYGSDPRSYANVMERVYEVCCQDQCGSLSQTDACQFQFWIAQTYHHRLGLERAIVGKLGDDKYWRRNVMLEAIYSIQEHSCSKKEESIRLACQAMSRPSCLFAAHLAQVAATCA